MGLAGLNDRDNTNNSYKNESLNSAYGISFFRLQSEKTPDKGNGNHFSYKPFDRCYYIHLNPYPKQYAEEFYRITHEFINIIKSIQKTYPMLNVRHVKSDADDYFKCARDLTCLAYDIPDLFLPDYIQYGMAGVCNKSKKEAFNIIESIFCSRGEAVSSLPTDEIAFFYNFQKKREEYGKTISELNRQIKLLNKDIKRPERYIAAKKNDSDDTQYAMKVLDNLKAEKNRHIETIRKLEQELNQYDITGKLKEIWEKIEKYGIING